MLSAWGKLVTYGMGDVQALTAQEIYSHRPALPEMN
jgi:hypothetical protein